MPRSTMSFRELAKKTSLRAGYLEYEVKEVLDKMVAALRESLEEGNVVTIDGLGKLYLKEVRQKVVKSGMKREAYVIPAGVRMKFVPSPTYEDTLNRRYNGK